MMDFQALCELADREIRLGVYDRPLMSRAMSEADGVITHAHQIYWRLRAMAIQTRANEMAPSDESLFLREIRARLDLEEKGRRLRASIVGWLWVVACFVGFVGAAVCFRFAAAAFTKDNSSICGYGIAGIAFLVLAIAAFIVCKRDAGQDPFAS